LKNDRSLDRWLTALSRAAGMSALAGDLGESGCVFAGLAAVVGVFLRGASASWMRTFGQHLGTHGSSNLSGRTTAAAQQVNDQDYACDHNQQMDQASCDVENKPQQPHNQKNRDDCSGDPHCHHLRRSLDSIDLTIPWSSRQSDVPGRRWRETL
jgi:hypothetical protein